MTNVNQGRLAVILVQVLWTCCKLEVEGNSDDGMLGIDESLADAVSSSLAAQTFSGDDFLDMDFSVQESEDSFAAESFDDWVDTADEAEMHYPDPLEEDEVFHTTCPIGRPQSRVTHSG